MSEKEKKHRFDNLRERTPGEIVEARRKELRWSQSDLEWKSGVSVSQISRIERNISNPTFETIERLEKALNISLLSAFLEDRKKKGSIQRRKTSSSVGELLEDFELELMKIGLSEDELRKLLKRFLREAEEIHNDNS